MATNVIMPQFGESVVEGTISRWLVQEGDAVDRLTALMEVSTDKVDTEVPAPASGVLLKIYYPEGSTVAAGTVVALIGQPGESLAGPLPAPPPPTLEAREEAPPPRPARDLGRISPIVARIAREHQVDLHQVPGTGRDGRITKKDILAYVEGRDQAAPVPAALPDEAPGQPTAAPAPLAPGPALDEELVPFSRLRRLIADHMVLSKRTSPHVTTFMEADLTAVVAHRRAHRAELAAAGVELTYTPYFLQAVLAGLKAVPQANAMWRDDGLLLRRRYHIGMATAVPDGLLVPVIHDAGDYSLQGLARKVNDLARRARAGQLQPAEIQGATFTVTNHGTSGSLFATPIINQPNTGILGVGAIQKRAVVISRGHPIEPSAEDYLAIRPMVYLSFTFDHRVLDGATADHFLMTVKQALETWPTLALS